MNICKYRELQLLSCNTQTSFSPFTFKDHAISFLPLHNLLNFTNHTPATLRLYVIGFAHNFFSPYLLLTIQFSSAVLQILSLLKKVPLYLQTSQAAARLQPTKAPYGQQQPANAPFSIHLSRDTIKHWWNTSSSAIQITCLHFFCAWRKPYTATAFQRCDAKTTTKKQWNLTSTILKKPQQNQRFLFPNSIFTVCKAHLTCLKCKLHHTCFYIYTKHEWTMEIPSSHTMHIFMPQWI